MPIKKYVSRDVLIILLIFVISRIIAGLMGIQFNIDPLRWYWQYLSMETLQHHLLLGVWYDHAQPPGFNLLLGIVMKLAGDNMSIVFSLLLKAITLGNVFLLLSILKKLTTNSYLPLSFCLLYLLSPATLIFEVELFYTTYVSFLLLLSMFFLLRFQQRKTWLFALGFYLPLAILCLSRNMYHLIWLILLTVPVIYYYKNKEGSRKLFFVASVSILMVTGLYLKNYILFDSFSSSTWLGMNLAKNVFHDAGITDSSHIEAYFPFSNIQVYKKFISGDWEKRFAGINDRDLLNATKTSGFPNEHQINYIEVSKKYEEACKQYIRLKPGKFVQNSMESAVIFFTPATIYTLRVNEVKKIEYYDIAYSFNLSHFFSGVQGRRVAIAISAIPKLVIYLFAFFFLIRASIKTKSISLLNQIIFITIAFVFLTSSVFEHAENMRFRYEIEPLFLILLAQVLDALLIKYRTKKGL